MGSRGAHQQAINSFAGSQVNGFDCLGKAEALVIQKTREQVAKGHIQQEYNDQTRHDPRDRAANRFNDQQNQKAAQNQFNGTNRSNIGDAALQILHFQHNVQRRKYRQECENIVQNTGGKLIGFLGCRIEKIG